MKLRATLLNYNTWKINFNDVEDAYVFLIKLKGHPVSYAP